MKDRAEELTKNFKPANHPKLGKVDFPRKGLKKTLMSLNTAHEFQSVQHIPELTEKGRVVSSEPDRMGRKDIVAVHKITSGLQIGENKYTAEITVRETADGAKTAQKFYLHRLLKNRKPAVHVAYPAIKPSRGPAGDLTITPESKSVKP